MSFFEKLFGSFSDKELKRINPLKDKVLALEPEMAKLTDDGCIEQFEGHWLDGVVETLLRK